jgi:hypothetical protein
MTCANCGATLTCGCQKKVASDGKLCCSKCVTSYEQKIKSNSSVDSQVLTIEQKIRLKK